MNPAQSASLAQLRGAIRSASLLDERRSVQDLVREAKGTLNGAARREALDQSRALVERCRAAGHRAGTLDAFLLEFGLSNDEGVTLLCLAEALLRIPDERTADALIAEKVRSGDWSGPHRPLPLLVRERLGLGPDAHRTPGHAAPGCRSQPPSLAATASPADWANRWCGRRLPKPCSILGGQYVLGRTLDEALAAADGPLTERPVSGFSYDMLGEAARTDADAGSDTSRPTPMRSKRWAKPRPAPRRRRPRACRSSSPPCIPRFEQRQRGRVLDELAPKLKALALQAKRHGLQFTLDAEEAARLELNLDLFEGLALGS